MASGNKRRYFFWEVCQTRSTTLTNPKTHHQLSVFFYAHWPTHPFASTAPPSVFRLGQPNFPWSCSPIDASLQSKVLNLVGTFQGTIGTGSDFQNRSEALHQFRVLPQPLNQLFFLW